MIRECHIRDFLAKSGYVTQCTDESDRGKPENDKTDAAYPGRHIAESGFVCTILYESISFLCSWAHSKPYINIVPDDVLR